MKKIEPKVQENQKLFIFFTANWIKNNRNAVSKFFTNKCMFNFSDQNLTKRYRMEELTSENRFGCHICLKTFKHKMHTLSSSHTNKKCVIITLQFVMGRSRGWLVPLIHHAFYINGLCQQHMNCCKQLIYGNVFVFIQAKLFLLQEECVWIGLRGSQACPNKKYIIP